jgi:hypothetical protein
MAEESGKTALNCTVESREAQIRTVAPSQIQSWSYYAVEELYTLKSVYA